MNRIVLLLFLGCASFQLHAQIVADHTVVDRYDDIPQQYIDIVKTMLVSIPGESHSYAYRLGMELLEEMDSKFQVRTYDRVSPPASSDQYLRTGRHIEMGEDYFFSQTMITQLKGQISAQNNTGNPFHVMGFGWCWDMTRGDAPGGTIDPVYQVHWAGRSEGSPEGSMRWGLDADDQAITGNSVSMDTYLEAVESYISFCTENSYPTTWIFTTGPVDWPEHAGSENGFQREIKHDYIRAYVAADPTSILFDYADILCWNNNGVQNITDWNDGGNIRPHAQIHPENMMDYNGSWDMIDHTEDGDHIGEVGTVRLAKAMWWLLARIAGWEDGISSSDQTESDPSMDSDISIYVDSDQFRVGTSGVFDSGKIRLFDLQGRLLESTNIKGKNTVINASSLSAGTYILLVSNDRKVESRKVVLIR